MVMGRRPGVAVASRAIATVDAVGLAGAFVAALARIPLRAPWRGPRNPLRNVAVASTREFLRSLIGYVTSLPIDEFRALELVLDDVSRAVLPPFVSAQGVGMTREEIGGVPGIWFRLRDTEPTGIRGRMVYLHGGGYIGTSPTMYALFMAHLARVTGCEVFAADYRLAPEFPYPAATNDILSVITALHAIHDVDDSHLPLFIAGDSGGGGLAGSVLNAEAMQGVMRPAAVVLFSPEVSLALKEPSVADNAQRDILPWNVPSNPYLHGVDPDDAGVSILGQDLSTWPPTFVAYGRDEIFRDAIRTFVDMLTDAGNLCEAYEAEGMFHVFPFLLPWARESRQVYDRVGEFLARVADLPAPR